MANFHFQEIHIRTESLIFVESLIEMLAKRTMTSEVVVEKLRRFASKSARLNNRPEDKRIEIRLSEKIDVD